MPDKALPTSLPGEINTATRCLHTTLNRLITSRLPLALPPHTSDPSLYTTGLLHFSHIFLTFESLWADLLPMPSDPPTSPLLSFLLVNPYDSPDLFSSPPSQRMLQFLTHLRPRGLARSARLKKDLEFLTGLHPTDLSVLLAQYPGDKVQEYCTHIRRVVKHKPHVLVAYAWCFYMAVFSGGRWIRGELVESGEEFWRNGTGTSGSNSSTQNTTEQDKLPLEHQGLSFWSFDSASDGEDIKAEFKRRLEAAESFFTDDERVDVIEEAKEIFKLSATLVEELDAQIGTDMEKLGIRQMEHAEARRVSEKAKEVEGQRGAEERVIPKVFQAPVMWFRRPEVTGAALALGCLACVALLRLDLGGDW